MKEVKTGRPTKYTDDLGYEICSRVADGEPMRSIAMSEHMPNKATIFKWIREIEDFSVSYNLAKEECADAMVEDILSIADNLEGDTNRDNLRINSRKWIAGKLKRKYSDRVQNENINIGMTHEEWLEKLK